MKINALPFDSFLKSLMPTNLKLNACVDWKKCLKNKNQISISLNHLNFLLRKDRDEIKGCIEELYQQFPKAFKALPILLAIRNTSEIFLDESNYSKSLQTYLQDQDSIFSFICQSGLIDIFTSGEIKNLNDYVFGIEVGLDTNAKKNRSGQWMEEILAKRFRDAKIGFQEQVRIQEFKDLHQAFGKDKKRFDFIIQAKQTFFIECSFYNGGGSKLNETARSYRELAKCFENLPRYRFVWVTDGRGWLKAKNKLQEAYESVEIYNLSHLDCLINEVICNV